MATEAQDKHVLHSPHISSSYLDVYTFVRMLCQQEELCTQRQGCTSSSLASQWACALEEERMVVAEEERMVVAEVLLGEDVAQLLFLVAAHHAGQCD